MAEVFLLGLGDKETPCTLPHVHLIPHCDGRQLVRCDFCYAVCRRQGGKPPLNSQYKLGHLVLNPKEIESWPWSCAWAWKGILPAAEPPDETAALADTLIAACERTRTRGTLIIHVLIPDSQNVWYNKYLLFSAAKVYGNNLLCSSR